MRDLAIVNVGQPTKGAAGTPVPTGLLAGGSVAAGTEVVATAGSLTPILTATMLGGEPWGQPACWDLLLHLKLC